MSRMNWKLSKPSLAIVLTSALALALLAIVVLASACGDDDDDGNASSFSQGDPVVCDRLASDSYKWTFFHQFTTDAPEIAPTDVAQGPGDAEFKQEVSGEVEDNDSYLAQISNEFPPGPPTEYGVVKDNGRSWAQRPTEWQEEDVSDGQPGTIIPHLPFTLCQAIAQDIDTAAEAQTEDIGGIASLRYDYAPLVSDFPERSQDITPQSDIAILVNEFNGSVWVADGGGYITKMELTGTGTYEDGTVLNVTYRYEVSDMGGEIDVDPPI